MYLDRDIVYVCFRVININDCYRQNYVILRQSQKGSLGSLSAVGPIASVGQLMLVTDILRQDYIKLKWVDVSLSA